MCFLFGRRDVQGPWSEPKWRRVHVGELWLPADNGRRTGLSNDPDDGCGCSGGYYGVGSERTHALASSGATLEMDEGAGRGPGPAGIGSSVAASATRAPLPQRWRLEGRRRVGWLE